jgi:hypothetical protein
MILTDTDERVEIQSYKERGGERGREGERERIDSFFIHESFSEMLEGKRFSVCYDLVMRLPCISHLMPINANFGRKSSKLCYSLLFGRFYKPNHFSCFFYYRRTFEKRFFLRSSMDRIYSICALVETPGGRDNFRLTLGGVIKVEM